MGLMESLREECIRVNITAVDKDAVLREIAAVASTCPVLSAATEAEILEALRKRESLGSTGLEHGIAIPHCSLDKVPEFVVGLVSHATGVDFQSLDGKPTRLLAFIVGPRSNRNDHVRLLSGISRVLHQMPVVSELLAAPSPTALRESFLRHLGATLGSDATQRKTAVTVIVQNEELFADVLKVLSEEDGCSVSVLDGHDCTEYLHGLPLFAAFWNERRRGFHRLILAVVRHSLANEMIRRIGAVTGDLKNARGIMVTAHELIYCEGALDL